MKKNSVIINKSAKELAKTMGLNTSHSVEWELRYAITKQIIKVFKNENFTVTEIAKNSGTSRARVTRILKDDTFGISIDVLLKVLEAVGESLKISFKKVA
jgi:hypothetical protein